MIKIRQKGDFSTTTRYLNRLENAEYLHGLERLCEQGVVALSSATPIDTGLTANSWYYRITNNQKRIRIEFLNSNVVDGVPIAIILQYGHVTGTGGWVEGRDYINPAIEPIFNEISNYIWEEVNRV